MSTVLILEDVEHISISSVGSVGAQACYFYLNVIIRDKQGREFEMSMSSKNKAVLEQFKKGGTDLKLPEAV